MPSHSYYSICIIVGGLAAVIVVSCRYVCTGGSWPAGRCHWGALVDQKQF